MDASRQHGQSEQSFSRSLTSYFRTQANRIAKASESFQAIGPDQMASIFRADDEHEILLPIIGRNLGLLIVNGAESELEAVKSPQDALKEVEDFQTLLAEELAQLPDVVRQRIKLALSELEEQPYWRAIQETTQTNLAGIIRQSIEAGETPHAMSVRIRDELGGFSARKRAMKIARTETTSALNAGIEASREDLVQAGLVTGKKWLTIGDRDVRAEHEALNGTTAAPREDFSVGGSLAPYPGHWSLPAGQRVFCRCTTVSVLSL